VAWDDGVVPFWVLLMRLEIQFLHLCIADLQSGFIVALVQNSLDAQSFARFLGADHVHDGLEAHEWLSSPVHADEGKHPVLDLIPLARARRIVADYHL
jgi:hypothetical protein